jgi:hypothetical protein
MARIELRDVTIFFEDGFSGNAVIEANVSINATTMNVNTVNVTSVNTSVEKVAVGTRFTTNTANDSTIYTVTATTEDGNGDTNTMNFSPAKVVASVTGDVVTFSGQHLEIKIGEGNLTWTETKEYEYVLDRGDLDTVKEGDEIPVEVNLEFAYEFIKSSSGTDITPVDALKQTGNASEWVSSSTDQCEPYCIDILAKHCVPCGTDEDEDVLLQFFRWETLDYDVGEATIAVTGRCNISSATVTRSTDAEC